MPRVRDGRSSCARRGAVREAEPPFLRTIEKFYFTFQSFIRLEMLGSFLGPELVTEGRCGTFSGPLGRGKTHLWCPSWMRVYEMGISSCLP